MKIGMIQSLGFVKQKFKLPANGKPLKQFISLIFLTISNKPIKLSPGEALVQSENTVSLAN